MRTTVPKQRANRRTAEENPKCVRTSPMGRVEFSQEIVEEAPPKKPLSIYSEETEIKDHQEEIVLAKSA